MVEPDRLTLSAATGSIRLSRTKRGWCQVSVTSEGEEHLLGAESDQYVVEHLCHALSGEPADEESAGTLDGYRVAWVMTLSERHGMVHVALDGNDAILFFSDENAKRLCVMRLREEERAGWRKRMRQWLR